MQWLGQWLVEWFGSGMQVVDLLGVLANAILGGLAAKAAKLDLAGFAIVAVISGLGGGMIRDALLQRGTVVALTDPWYLAIALVGATVAYLINFSHHLPRRALVLLDAMAVGCWAAVGAQKGLDAGLSWLAAVLLGVVTVIGGGMVRDVLLMKRPVVLGGNTLYATSACLAAVCMVVATRLGEQTVGVGLALATGAGLSLLARKLGWRLPTERRAWLRRGHRGEP